MTEKAKINKDTQKVVTPQFRVSYPHLFKPSGMAGTPKKEYSVVMLFPKDADLTILKNAMAAAKESKWGKKENWKKCESPVKDGDNAKYAGKEGYAGHYAIRAATGEDYAPGVIDYRGKEKGQPITNPAIVYPGCFARAQVLAVVWEFPVNSGKFGIKFILDNVQKLKDGTSFGGRKAAGDVFTPFDGGDEEFGVEADDDDFAAQPEDDDDIDFT